MKKSLAFLLCLIMILSSLAGCSNENETPVTGDVGDEITVYLGEPVYNFDPAESYKNETSLKITSLLFDNLFVLDDDGKVQKSLVDDYDYDDDTNTMTIKLKEDAYWSDGKILLADDVMFTWQRILSPSSSFEAASLLYDIKNAKAVKNGATTEKGEPITVDDIGISALNPHEIEIKFENDKVDIDSFLLKLTSTALSPVREDIVGSTKVANDWAKSKLTLVTSGPFRLSSVNYDENLTDPQNPQYQQIVLERNVYYFRDYANDPINKTVYPCKIVVKLSKANESIVDLYNQGAISYLGDIPLAERAKYTIQQWTEMAEITDALSTNMIIFNQQAKINNVELFANPAVRKALSLAIDRQAIANAIVFAKPATGIVPNGVFNETSTGDLFREESDATQISANANPAAAQLLSQAGIVANTYTFSISVPSYDEVHVTIANMIAAYWRTLGFNVNVKPIAVIPNQDTAALLGDVIQGVKDDKFIESITPSLDETTQTTKLDFEVALIDYVALSADAFSTLAPFAFGYAGTPTNHAKSPTFNIMPHISGYRNATFEQTIVAASVEVDSNKRATLLHNAEKILLEDLPVIPIVFNQNVVLQKDNLEDVGFNYYQNPSFTQAIIAKD